MTNVISEAHEPQIGVYFMKIPNKFVTSDKAIVFIMDQTKRLPTIKADDVLESAFAVMLFFNSLPEQQKGDVLEKVLQYLKKLKKKLDAIAKEWGISGYSIDVGTTGFDLSLQFDTSKAHGKTK